MWFMYELTPTKKGVKTHRQRGTFLSCSAFKQYPSIHPSIFYTCLLRAMGDWSLSQLPLSKRQGTPWTRCQSITEPHRDKQPCTFTLTLRGNLVSSLITNYLTCTFFSWWEESGVPGENPHVHRENM